MNKSPTQKFGDRIPETREAVQKYGCRLRDNPPFVLVGQYNSAELGHPMMGILAAAENEFHAHLLRREFRKAGFCDIKKTEHHPDGDFSIEAYKEEVRQRMAKKETK